MMITGKIYTENTSNVHFYNTGGTLELLKFYQSTTSCWKDRTQDEARIYTSSTTRTKNNKVEKNMEDVIGRMFPKPRPAREPSS